MLRPIPKRDWKLVKKRHLERMKVRGYARRTLETVETHLRSFFDYLDEQAGLRDLARVDRRGLHQYLAWLCAAPSRNGEPLCVNSRQRRLWAVQGLFRFLHGEGFLPSDPAADLERPRYRRPLPRAILTPGQVLALLEAPDTGSPLGIRDRAILELLYATGIRNAELLTLKLGDVSLENRQILVAGKGGRERAVPLGWVSQAWLLKYLRDARPLLAVRGSPGNVFLTRRGRAFARANLCQMVRKRAKEAGLPSFVTPHALRHTCATHLLQAGADIRFIQELLGHASLSTTQIYTHVDITDLKRVHAAFHPREACCTERAECRAEDV